uniref:Uncharacterized protein n=1 Tax=Anguilla anguilla TaxID=7936 RepID=A0A0E9WYX1_ANGAN
MPARAHTCTHTHYTHTHSCTHTHTCTHRYIHMHTRTHTCPQMHVHTHIHKHAHTFLCKSLGRVGVHGEKLQSSSHFTTLSFYFIFLNHGTCNFLYRRKFQTVLLNAAVFLYAVS